MMKVCGLNTCGHNVDQLRALVKNGNATPTAIKFGDFLTHWGAVLQSHQTQQRTASKSLFFFLSSGASTRFRAMVSLYEAARSHSLDTPHSVGFLWSSDQPEADRLPDNTQHFTRDKYSCPGGIRTYNSSKRAAAESRHRPRGHWDRQLLTEG